MNEYDRWLEKPYQLDEDDLRKRQDEKDAAREEIEDRKREESVDATD